MKRIFSPRGFSLVETVAVLVVMGVIIGGLWLTYASVNHRRQMTQYEQIISKLLQATRDYVSQYNEYEQPNNKAYNVPANTVRNITDDMINKNLMPPGVVAGSASNTFEMENNIVGNIVTAPSPANPYNSGPLVGVRLTGISQANCRDMLNVWGGSPGRIRDSGLVIIVMQTSVFGGANLFANNLFETLPANSTSLQPSDIDTACNLAQNNVITYFFRLNR